VNCGTCGLFTPPDDGALAFWKLFARRHEGVGECPGFCPRTFSRENGGIRPTRAGDPACEEYRGGGGATAPRPPVAARQPDLLDADGE
jgi:hypothetical protein